MAPEVLDLPALKARDDCAWTQAFHHLWPKAWAAARHSAAAASREDVEEAATQALADLVDLVDAAENGRDLEALAVVLASRRAASSTRLRLAGKRGALVTSSWDACELAEIASFHAETSTVSDMELAELTKLLHSALSVLDPETRKLLEGNTFLEFTYAELSQIYQMPLGTVAARISRGLKRVARSLKGSPNLLQALRDYLR